MSTSQIYERYNLISPDTTKSMADEGEGEDSDSNKSRNLSDEDVKKENNVT